jgi:hypothetical protein
MNKLRPELARSQIIELIRRTVIYRVQQDLEKSNNKRTPQFISIPTGGKPVGGEGNLKSHLLGWLGGNYIFMLYVFDILGKIIYNYQGYLQIIPWIHKLLTNTGLLCC